MMSPAPDARRSASRGLRKWALFCSLALFLHLPGLLLANPYGTDGPVHVRWQASYPHAFWSGTVFPRWLPEMNDGFGSPAFFFYPPLLQWLAALIAPLLPGDDEAIRRLTVVLTVLSVAGAMGCHTWIRSLGGSRGASLLAGTMWLVAPYVAFVDTYQRSALAESASLCVLPWLGVFAVGLVDRRRGAWVGFALAVALLAYTHMPGMVIGYLFTAGLGLALLLTVGGWRQRGWAMIALATSAATGLVLAGAMLVPALSLLGHLVDTTAMFGGRNQPRNWLLFSGSPWIDPVARLMTLGVMTMTLAMSAILGRAAVHGPRPTARAVGWAMLGAVLVVSFLNLGMSRPIWDLQTPLSRIQFPFRMLGVSSLAVSILAGLAYDVLGNGARGWQRRMLWIMPFALLAGDIAAFAYQRLRPRDTFPMTVGEILGSNEDSSEYVLGDLSTAVQRFGGRLAIDPDGPQPALVRANIDNRLVTVDYRAARAGWLALHQFAFTGWQCRIDGANWFSAESYQPGAASVSRSKPGGLVPMCRVPAGAHRLEARLPRPSSEEWGIRISLCGIAAVLLALLTGRRFRDDGIPGGRAA